MLDIKKKEDKVLRVLVEFSLEIVRYHIKHPYKKNLDFIAHFEDEIKVHNFASNNESIIK